MKRSSMARFPELAIRGETLELPGRRARGPTRAEMRYASILERYGDVALLALPLHLLLVVREVFSAKPPTLRFSSGWVDVEGNRLEVESIRGDAAHGGGGQLVAICRGGDEIVLPLGLDLSIGAAKDLAAILDAHVHVAERPTYR
jgi:hypothetical protein